MPCSENLKRFLHSKDIRFKCFRCKSFDSEYEFKSNCEKEKQIVWVEEQVKVLYLFRLQYLNFYMTMLAKVHHTSKQIFVVFIKTLIFIFCCLLKGKQQSHN